MVHFVEVKIARDTVRLNNWCHANTAPEEARLLRT